MEQKVLETTEKKSRDKGALFGWFADKLGPQNSLMVYCLSIVLLTSLGGAVVAFVSGMAYTAEESWGDSVMEDVWFYTSDFIAAALFLVAVAFLAIGLRRNNAKFLLAAAVTYALMIFIPMTRFIPFSSAILCVQAFLRTRREKREPGIPQDRRYLWKALLSVYLAFAIFAIVIFAWSAINAPEPAGELPEWLTDDSGWVIETQDETYPWEALEGFIAIYLPLVILFAAPVLMGVAVLTDKRRWARLAVIPMPIYIVLSNFIYGEWLLNLISLALQPEFYIGLYIFFEKDRGGAGSGAK